MWYDTALISLNPFINNVCVGVYQLYVTDTNGCTVTDSIEIPASAVVDITLDASNSTLSVLCNGFQSAF